MIKRLPILFITVLCAIMFMIPAPAAFAELKEETLNETDIDFVQPVFKENQYSRSKTRGSYDAESLIDADTKGTVDPDFYMGTDADRIEAAMASIGETGHGVILIKRLFTLDRDVFVYHSGKADSRIIFQGCGNACGFKLGSHSFKAADNRTSYGMLSFVNLKFNGSGVIFTSDYLIRVTFENCMFDGGVNIVRNGRYMQSWSFNNCTIRNTSSYVIDNRTKVFSDVMPSMNDVIFHGCLVEQCAGFIDAQRMYGVSIMQCCIEGLSNCICKVTYEAQMLSVIGNYFEHNHDRVRNPDFDKSVRESEENPKYIGDGGEGVHFDFSALKTNQSSITISSNLFTTKIYEPDEENNIILLPPSDSQIGTMIVENNITSQSEKIYLVKANRAAGSIYSSVYLSNNHSNYNGGDNNSLFDASMANLGAVNELHDNDSLNNINQPGVYHASADMVLDNRPDSGEFFLIHLRTDDSFAQIAITDDGIQSRIGNGEWK